MLIPKTTGKILMLCGWILLLTQCGTPASEYWVDGSLYTQPVITRQPDGSVTYEPGQGYSNQAFWADEFNGSDISESNWNYEILEPGSYNEELQYYIRSNATAFISNEGDGALAIRAVQTNALIASGSYLSARLNTYGKQSFLYGKIVARIKLPYGLGIWPAFWMLGTNFSGLGGNTGWPACGEVDIMEFFGGTTLGDNQSLAALHGPGYSGDYPDKAVYTNSTDFRHDYHIFEIEWTENRVTHLIDGKAFHTSTPSDVSGEWVFNRPFFLILNFAVGGWGFNPDSGTVFPQAMLVDWVRVYRKY